MFNIGFLPFFYTGIPHLTNNIFQYSESEDLLRDVSTT